MKTEDNKKIRLSVPLSEPIYKRIEEEASLRGISMSTYVAFLIGEHFANYDRITNKSLADISLGINQSFKHGDDLAEKVFNDNPELVLKLLSKAFSSSNEK